MLRYSFSIKNKMNKMANYVVISNLIVIDLNRLQYLFKNLKYCELESIVIYIALFFYQSIPNF